VFNDREARRFAYAPFGPWLALLAAGALLLSVGSRRLALPDFMRRRTTNKVAPEAENENTQSGNETKAENRTLGALRAKMGRRTEPRAEIPPSAETPPSLLIRPNDAQTPAQQPQAPATQVSASERSDAPAQPEKRSAAEILLERRRARTRR
jgi:hypothetical protein